MQYAGSLATPFVALKRQFMSGYKPEGAIGKNVVFQSRPCCIIVNFEVLVSRESLRIIYWHPSGNYRRIDRMGVFLSSDDRYILNSYLEPHAIADVESAIMKVNSYRLSDMQK
jgi:hypothetical protein